MGAGEIGWGKSRPPPFTGIKTDHKKRKNWMMMIWHAELFLFFKSLRGCFYYDSSGFGLLAKLLQEQQEKLVAFLSKSLQDAFQPSRYPL